MIFEVSPISEVFPETKRVYEFFLSLCRCRDESEKEGGAEKWDVHDVYVSVRVLES